MTNGRGRPAVFDTTAQRAYLKARAEGATQKDAAAAAGVSPRTIRDAYKRVPGFRDTDRKIHQAAMPHNEARQRNHGCTCRTCTADATAARTARRDRQKTATPKEDTATVAMINHKPAAMASPEAFPLAAAS